jgi:hypothetical protein
VVLVVATPPAAVVVVVVGNVVVVDVDVVVVVAFGSTIAVSNCPAMAVPPGPDTTVLRQKVYEPAAIVVAVNPFKVNAAEPKTNVAGLAASCIAGGELASEVR